MSGWTLGGLRASIYKFGTLCCGREVTLSVAEFDALIARYGEAAEWNAIAERAVCRSCGKRLRFTLSPRDQKVYDMAQAYRPVV